MAPPTLASVMTPSLLSTIRNHPTLPPHGWYIVAASALTILNRPDEVAKVWSFAIEDGSHGVKHEPDQERQRRITRRIREALIKTSAVGGVPKTINSLLSLKQVTPPELIDEPGSPSPTGRLRDLYDVPASEVLRRGQSFFEKVYGKIAKRIMGQMDRSGTEDLGLTARLVYGHVLSNISILSPIETSFVMIAGLIPQDVNPQLKGHLRGALNGGATVEEVRAVREVAMQICEASGMQRLAEDAVGGWGWRTEVANV
ncbi:AhpD-like protein [Truncatella angustata]|uniref:AhpD-like protein n=1 Tax=Truncatella angustata TaxID=152316 RepID=A0A9P8UN82_9PEZI|nr:AhpD-like protein [Truncatella angustata]KAH6655260.1 AhpD-like protein [Truncatella angustata]